MNNKTMSKKRKIESAIIISFCTVVIACVLYVLLGLYEPNRNALGALGTVCMDVVCMISILVLVINIVFERDELNRTTKLFLCLMLVTLVGLFFDFLTWSSDGLLAFSDWTYVFTVSSLVCGSILGGFFVLYLGSYLYEVYELKSAINCAKICALCNAFAFLLTLTLALTKTAFDFVDGHYQTGVLYDLVTAIPVLTLLFMTGYAIRNVRVIGIHDVIAVAGYIIFMICGVLIESSYSIGTTYVAVTIADIFIFVMLQNKLINKVQKQREILTEKIATQYEILESMAGIYSYVNFVDLEGNIVRRFDSNDSLIQKLDIENDPHSELNKILYEGMEDDLKEKFFAYTDLSTLNSRMGKEKIISADFCHKYDGWLRAQYIRIGEDVNEPIKRVIYAIRNIDEEKKNVEKWIRKSNTDELTGFFNRHAYEEEIASLEGGKMKENFVYVSMDVNSLKMVNDSLGHEAGDELIVGAAECMRQCFGSYGKIYRTGGDEFAALIFADDIQLSELQKDVEEVTEKWSGKLISELAISCGYVKGKEADNMTLHQIAVLADKRMYEAKSKYYQKKGIDRRGQRDAHVALCALYTKILKINITEDTFQIVNMDSDEKTSEKGYADTISKWLNDFGMSGQVHPDDLEEYLAKTRLEYISEYFKSGKKDLHIFYRRRYADEFKPVIMEIIPASDYEDDSQSLFLYVKNIEQ